MTANPSINTARHLDHVVVVVEDLDESAASLEDIGFSVTERSDHPFGTSNRLVMLDGTYLEFIAVTDPSAVPNAVFSRFVADALAAGRTGPRLVVFRTDDPESDRNRLAAAGVDMELLRFGRDARLPDGSTNHVEFVTAVGAFTNPVETFLCQHLTPEIVWHPSLLEHRNGAGRLLSVAVNDPGPGGWDRIAMMASVSSGPPVAAANVPIDQGKPLIVVEGATPGRATVGDTTIDVVTPES